MTKRNNGAEGIVNQMTLDGLKIIIIRVFKSGRGDRVMSDKKLMPIVGSVDEGNEPRNAAFISWTRNSCIPENLQKQS